MKKSILSLLIFLIATNAHIAAKIIEAPHFKNVLDHVANNTLVVLDIDETLLVPCQTLGTSEWFYTRKRQYESQGMNQACALDKALAEWEAIRHLTTVRIVEQGTDAIISNLQSKNIPVMGLTTQGLALATRTVEQLNSLNIDLLKTAPTKEDCYFINGHGVLFRKGILFTSGTQKGKALVKLLDTIQFRPGRIVFVNDRETHIKDVEGPVEERGIEFIGIRYGYFDKELTNYRHDVAELEWSMSSFDHLMQDAEAIELLNTESSS